MKNLYFTHCSAKKNDKFRGTSEKVSPRDLYNATYIQRFIRQCEALNLDWAIFSDEYGFVFSRDKIGWYEKHPSKVLSNQSEFDQLINKAYYQLGDYELVFFYHNPGRFHPLYELLIRALQERGVKIKGITHLYEIKKKEAVKPTKYTYP